MLIRLALLAFIGTALVWSALISLGLTATPFARTMIRIRAGQLIVTGVLTPRARDHLADVLRGAGIQNGFITISANDRVRFSQLIPSSMHQQLRNIILN